VAFDVDIQRVAVGPVRGIGGDDRRADFAQWTGRDAEMIVTVRRQTAGQIERLKVMIGETGRGGCRWNGTPGVASNDQHVGRILGSRARC
jgi:hypothetical protein